MTFAILLLGLGLALVVAEVLFPSFGVLSILATLAIVGAVVMAFRESSATGFNFLLATIVLLPAAIFLGLKVFPKSPIGRRMVAQGLSFESQPATDSRDRDLKGAVGDVDADCRPTGVARIEGRRVDVVTRGEWIEAGERIKVVEVSGNRVVVARDAAETS
jgi:membrane-bound ClpP family serine protease